MKLGKFLAAGMLYLSAVSAQASTVFTATDGNVNFAFSNLGSYSLYMFDDDTVAMTLLSGLEVPTPSIVTFENSIITAGDYTASSATADIELSNTKSFILALYDTSVDGGAWILDDNNPQYFGADIYTISFNLGNNATMLVDVEVNPVPVPAAVWLFGTGLIGLAGVARRRS